MSTFALNRDFTSNPVVSVKIALYANGCALAPERPHLLVLFCGKRPNRTMAFRCCPFVMLQSPTPSVIINQLTSRLHPNYGMPTLPQANKPSFQELRILRRSHSARSALA